jgi:hypothetical protein
MGSSRHLVIQDLVIDNLVIDYLVNSSSGGSIFENFVVFVSS